MKRQHPVAFLRYTSKNFWLLLIPLVRGLLHVRFDLYSWARGAYIDIIVLLIIISLAVIKWYNIKFEITENGISIEDGVFVRKKFKVSFSSAATLKTGRQFFLRPFKAVFFYFDTDTVSVGNKSGDPDFKLILKLTDYKEICSKIPFAEPDKSKLIRFSKWRLLLFSLVFSSTLSGLVYFAALFIQGGRLIDKELEKSFVAVVNDVTRAAENVIWGVTPFAVSVMIVIGFGWLISFFSNYLRHMNFQIARTGKNLCIKNGLLSEWVCRINTEKINYIDLRQNLLMKLCRVMSVQVSSSGYGKIKNEIPVIIPVTDRQNGARLMGMLLPEIPQGSTKINPQKNYLLRFEALPVIMIFGIQLLAFLMLMFFPAWYKVIFFTAVMGEILSLHFYIVSLVSYFTNGIGSDRGVLTLKYIKFLRFHHVSIPLGKVVKVKIRQTFLQKRNGSCDLIIFTVNEKKGRHRVNGLNFDDVVSILEKEQAYG